MEFEKPMGRVKILVSEIVPPPVSPLGVGAATWGDGPRARREPGPPAQDCAAGGGPALSAFAGFSGITVRRAGLGLLWAVPPRASPLPVASASPRTVLETQHPRPYPSPTELEPAFLRVPGYSHTYQVCEVKCEVK